jgi:hypothetical protein
MSASALLCLRLCVALQCVAEARSAWITGSEVNGWLFMRAGLPESAAILTDQVAAVLLVAVAASALFRPMRPLLFLGAAWLAAIALAIWSNPGTTVDSLAPLAHAVRVAAPLGLALLLPKPRGLFHQRPPQASVGVWILLLGAAATFTAHGMEALEHYGRFVDLIIGSADRWIGWDVSQAQAETALTIIGVHDILLAALLLMRRWRWIAGWMALWGFATALSRVSAMGGDSWHQAAARMANGAVPLALFLAWWQVVRSPASKTSP